MGIALGFVKSAVHLPRIFSKYPFTGHHISSNNSIKAQIHCWKLWCWIRSHYTQPSCYYKEVVPWEVMAGSSYLRPSYQNSVTAGIFKTFANIFPEACCAQVSSIALPLYQLPLNSEKRSKSRHNQPCVLEDKVYIPRTKPHWDICIILVDCGELRSSWSAEDARNAWCLAVPQFIQFSFSFVLFSHKDSIN